MSCSIEVEAVFGPTVNPSCLNGFDFTLYFEESILSLPLSAISTALFILRALQLYSKAATTDGLWLNFAKVAAFAVQVALNCALLGLWAGTSAPKTSITVSAAALSLTCSTLALLLTTVEHRLSYRPSKLLQLYVGLSILLDLPRARTLWFMVDNNIVAALFTACLVLKIPVLCFESLSKRPYLKPEYQNVSVESTSGLFSQYLFLWVNQQLRQGYRGVLSLADLLKADETLLEQENANGGLQKRFAASNSTSINSLFLSAAVHYKRAIFAGVLPRILLLGFTLAQPYLVGAATSYINQPSTNGSINNGYGLIGAFAVVYIGIATMTAMSQHKTYRMITMLRGSLVTMIYDKTVSLNISSEDGNEPVTLMSADIERVASGLNLLHETWAGLAQIPLALWLLWNQLGVAAIGPIIVAVTVMGIAVSLAMLAGDRQKMWLEAIENRVTATTKMLSSIKGVKLLGMTEKAFTDLQDLKHIEIKKSEKFRTLLIAAAALGFGNTAMAPVISFAIYTIRAQINGTETLTTTKAMTCLALFTLVTNPMTILVEALAGLASAIGSFARINTFLNKESRIETRTFDIASPTYDEKKALRVHLQEKRASTPTESEIIQPLSSQTSSLSSSDWCNSGKIVSTNRSCGWGNEKAPILSDLTFEIRASTLNIVVGSVGCGKSTFLFGLLGETPDVGGTLQLSRPDVAFCAQTPWLTNQTLKQNVLGESEYAEELYESVLTACALKPDLKALPHGDQTMLGSNGATLSGGQKQRISLARAVYSRKSIVILDDVLSGLDNTTEEIVARQVFGPQGLFRQRGTTVVLATNSVHHLPMADNVIVLSSEGRISQQGSFQELNMIPGFVQNLLLEEKALEEQSNTEPAKDEKSAAAKLPDELNTPGDATEQDLKVYMYYVRSIGYTRWIIFLSCLAILVFFSAFPVLWVTYWAEANDSNPGEKLGMYLGVYFFLGIGACVFIVLSAWHLMANMVSKAASVLHARLLRSVLNAPMSFFTTTDLGNITNRFSQDLQLIDMELPISLLNTCLTAFSCLAQLIVISVTTKYLAATIPLCLAVFYVIQRFYLRTARQIRFIDIEAKAPLFSQFLETLSGLVSIRAYNWVKDYKQKNRELLDESQKPFYLMYCIQRWLEVVVGLSVAGLAVLLIGVAVASKGNIEAGFIGAALVNIVTFSENIQGLIIHWTVLETSIGAVARVKAFTEQTANENLPSEDEKPPPGWPHEGRIEFKGISASYKKSLGPVLKNVSLDIKAGEKLAIVGRTGSGKSSLVSTLFRTLELDTGSIFVDGVDLSYLIRQDIRSHLIVIPQEPYLIRGSIRLNVDPSGKLSDDAIIKALQTVQLWETIQKQGGLDINVTNDVLSHGQRQLLCLASATLRTGRIVVLDEATSSVDKQTDELMQEVIRSEFQDRTIIAIAHRLDTILDFDRVVVMDHGVIAEAGNPQQLLDAPQVDGSPSRFKDLYLGSSNISKDVTKSTLLSDTTNLPKSHHHGFADASARQAPEAPTLQRMLQEDIRNSGPKRHSQTQALAELFNASLDDLMLSRPSTRGSNRVSLDMSPSGSEGDASSPTVSEQSMVESREDHAYASLESIFDSMDFRRSASIASPHDQSQRNSTAEGGITNTFDGMDLEISNDEHTQGGSRELESRPQSLRGVFSATFDDFDSFVVGPSEHGDLETGLGMSSSSGSKGKGVER